MYTQDKIKEFNTYLDLIDMKLVLEDDTILLVHYHPVIELFDEYYYGENYEPTSKLKKHEKVGTFTFLKNLEKDNYMMEFLKPLIQLVNKNKMLEELLEGNTPSKRKI